MILSQMQYYKQQKGYSFAKLSELLGVPVGIFEGELQIDFKKIREYLKGYGNLEEE